ncbi:MAG TPA: hypothetical protein VHX88_07105 [Solirubrobacteraceae bacterium]|jgi:hypothetical protein|nr:hypothetical protein [Solirubrobacteraceae bacterium]
MLTKADELPIHQTPEPIAYSGTDRNFYDRSFFAGYAPDASTVFEIAFGVYPHVNLTDAHIGILRDGTHHAIHASRHLNMERMNMHVGPIRIEVIEHLRSLRIVVDDYEGISADLRFDGRAFPVEEPQFKWRVGPRMFWNYTRFSQNGHWSGWIEVDGRREQLPPGSAGTRDRSWGVRALGAADEQPWVPERPQQFFWTWTPVNLADSSAFFHLQAEHDGAVVNTRGVLCPDGAHPGEMTETSAATLDLAFAEPTRWPTAGTVEIAPPGTPAVTLAFEPLTRFIMSAIGYGPHPTWGHGTYHGELAVEREDFALVDVNPADPRQLHNHAISRVTLSRDGQPDEVGIGILETMILGPYEPLGFTDLSGPQLARVGG